VVTANKALLAHHGNEIFAAAQKKARDGRVRRRRRRRDADHQGAARGLSANRIEWIAGIINGTSNFILSEMREKGLPFATALKDAQKKGYAEADPTFDIEGIDAAHKLTILSALAFGIPMQFAKAYTEGISALTREDIAYAEQLGYRIKLLGITRARRRASNCACTRRSCRRAADRERRRRDERSARQGRRGRPDAVLRRRRRQPADRRARSLPTSST
jgi:homoserine dehydrogenase